MPIVPNPDLFPFNPDALFYHRPMLKIISFPCTNLSDSQGVLNEAIIGKGLRHSIKSR